jgi:hypothetical protein
MRCKVLSLIAAAATLLAAAPALGAVGDVISSFPWPSARNAYRDASYVYCVVGTNTLRRYTVGGSLAGTVALRGLTAAADADHCVAGAGRMTVLGGGNRIFEYRISNGSLIRSFAASPSTTGYGYSPGRAYYFVHSGADVYRYTKAGSLVSSFTVSYSAGPIAVADRFRNRAGNYVIVGSRLGFHATVYTGSGSRVTSFVLPAVTYGCVCGPGAPSTYGTTYWCNLRMGTGFYAYQIDLGNATAVAPTSVGRIKALYR